MPGIEKQSDQNPPSYMNPTADVIEESFRRLVQNEKERQQVEGCFDNHPVSHVRNRWASVRAYTHNRVRLRGSGFDYINASPIEIGDLKFIATQNPTYIRDFWRMTWDENANSIIMLMPVSANGEERCARYFPRDIDDVIKIGDFEIMLVEKVTEHPRIEIRQLRVVRGDESRTVWHFAFLGWNDSSIPLGNDKVAFLELVKLSRTFLKANIPRIVHCSAGVGRTGTFIALDYLLEELERRALDHELELDPVFEVVDYLREKRMMMVQNEIQYRFIYDTLRSRWNDMHGVGEDIGSNINYTYVIGAKNSVRRPRWQGISQRLKASNGDGVESHTKPTLEGESVSNGDAMNGHTSNGSL